jgi:hypothetical protein
MKLQFLEVLSKIRNLLLEITEVFLIKLYIFSKNI